MKTKGTVQIYTGNGKGKTTAALGLALRAAGHGQKTYFGQFLKGRPTGEHAAAELLSPLLTMESFGRTEFILMTETLVEEDRERALGGLGKCRQAMNSGSFQIIVLDEVLVAVLFGILKEEEVLDFIRNRPEGVELILTGRGATPALVDEADLVTEMVEIKHYYAKGVHPRDGIER
jgi:cob(I)alamin adenosyltransferase